MSQSEQGLTLCRRLQGEAHAGVGGNGDARIAALMLSPQRLSIAGIGASERLWLSVLAAFALRSRARHLKALVCRCLQQRTPVTTRRCSQPVSPQVEKPSHYPLIFH